MSTSVEIKSEEMSNHSKEDETMNETEETNKKTEEDATMEDETE
jgi:hypothetical protein